MKGLGFFLCLTLAGCALGGRQNSGMVAVYDLGPPALRQPRAMDLPTLELEIRAPAWLETPGIAYRLAYAEPGRLRYYGWARWAAPPARLIEQGLMQRLGFVDGQGGASCLLRLDLEEFSQIFEAPERSRGVLQARLSLLDRRRKSLAGQALTLEVAAPSQDSSGGRAALAQTVEQLAGAIGSWQAELAASGRLGACVPERQPGDPVYP